MALQRRRDALKAIWRKKPQWMAFFIQLRYKSEIIGSGSHILAECCSGTKLLLLLLLLVSRSGGDIRLQSSCWAAGPLGPPHGAAFSSGCFGELRPPLFNTDIIIDYWSSASGSAVSLLATSLHSVAPRCVYIANSMKPEAAAILPLLFLLPRTLEWLPHIKESWSHLHFGRRKASSCNLNVISRYTAAIITVI